MKFMEIIYNYLMRVGMTSHQSMKKYPFNVRNSIILFLLFIDITGIVMYLIFDAKTLKEYTDSIYLIITLFAVILNFVIVTWKMAEIFRFFQILDDIVNTRFMDSTLKTIYTLTGEKIRKLVKTLDITFTKVSPQCTIVLPFIGNVVAYFTTDLGADVFELPFPNMWFPFDVKNTFGYLTAVATQFILTTNNNLTAVCVLIIVIAPCLILISTTDDMKCGLSILNTSARTKETNFKITQLFNQFVQFHSKAKQLVNDFSEIVQFIFLIYFTWSIGSICLTMFAILFELRENAPNSIVFQSFTLLITSFVFVFLPCEFGHKLSNSFIEIDYAIGQMHWYKFPQKLRKMLPFLLTATQDPIQLRVFGSTSCSRGDFQRVVNSGFSYFMVLQRFEN